ncbi:isoaspartyl peptidase/L-asparaginase family protein [Pontibacter lucknowensis]|uniref:Isoaspartyl peptidase n=1 Tax=Pontibacter lucknowensis TaxID=1077936 RepID=A0A1N6WZD2_9BACT|nr:isoaspartyl peptidase/L-asparaginase [Pontibacter lucknowensis]SIQ95381.1 beta-aspartyl-peptidase (threonine type) [Pontibacter lucknowensis]
MQNLAIAIHGGAGTITPASMTPDLEKAYKSTLSHALNQSYQILEKGGSALDAVELAVALLEDSPLFNAGRGSVFTKEGKHEMDAAIMCGKTMEAGAVAGVRSIRNPVRLTRAILEHSDHVFLCGYGAEEFARKYDIAFEPEEYFYDKHRYKQWRDVRDTDIFMLDHTEDRKFGTVGAVARDANGDLAAATSTGGMTNKNYNRIGDSPVIGSGTYANNDTCAISCTGHGEFFIRAVVAYDVSCLMEYKGYTLQEACDEVVMDKLVRFGGEGGLIAVDNKGNIALPFNSEGMYRGYRTSQDQEGRVSIYKN